MVDGARPGLTLPEAGQTGHPATGFIHQGRSCWWGTNTGVSRLTAPAGARPGAPGLDRLGREPHGEAAAGAQAGVVLGPVGHPVALPRDVAPAIGVGLERQGGSTLDIRGLALLANLPAGTKPGDPCNNVVAWPTRCDIIFTLVKRIEVADDVVRVVFRVEPGPSGPHEPRRALPHCPTRGGPAQDAGRRQPVRRRARRRGGQRRKRRHRGFGRPETPAVRSEVPSPGRWIRPSRDRPSGAARMTALC